MKWGTIIGALVAGAGWIAAQGGGGGVGQLGGGGMMSFLGGLILDAINGKGQNAAGGSRSRSRSQSQSRTRSKPWEPFQQSRGQHSSNADRNNNNNERTAGEDGTVQGIIGSILEAAEKGGWLDAARNAMDGFQNAGTAGDDDGAGKRKQPSRKAKTKARGAR